jgi:hypothetical protein
MSFRAQLGAPTMLPQPRADTLTPRHRPLISVATWKSHDAVHKNLAELLHLAMIIVGPMPTGHTGTDGACRESPRLRRNRRSDRIDRVGRGRLGATRQVVIGASTRASGD